MRKISKTRRIRASGFLPGALLATLLLAGCGGDDFENEPRPPVPVQLTGVITEKRMTVSPRRLGAGPIVLTISNQTEGPHTVTLAGGTVRETVGPIAPRDTGTIQKTLATGEYTVAAGSPRAVAKRDQILPAKLVIGKPRDSASDELLLP